MTKKPLNQNGIYVQELINNVEPDFVFSDKPINRLNVVENKKLDKNKEKSIQLSELREKINTIENCKLKNNSKKIGLTFPCRVLIRCQTLCLTK